MVLEIQKLSNYGTATPAVARTVVQASEILSFFAVSGEQREQAMVVLNELKRQLVRCVEVRDRLFGEAMVAHEEFGRPGWRTQAEGRAVTLPSVPDLESQAESFLQAAKLAAGQTSLLITPFFGEAFHHRFDRFGAWSEKRFGAEDLFTKAIRSWEPWVTRFVEMRNAVEHPSDRTGGRLVTRNFSRQVVAGSPVLVDPSWCLLGQAEVPMLPDMTSVIDGIIELGEEVLCGLFEKLKVQPNLTVYGIAPEDRDEKCPTRLRVGLLSSCEPRHQTGAGESQHD